MRHLCEHGGDRPSRPRHEEETMASRTTLLPAEWLPRDRHRAVLIGRAWIPAEGGPSVIGVRGDDAVDLTRWHPTVSHLLNVAKAADVRAAMRAAPTLGRIADIIANSTEGERNP